MTFKTSNIHYRVIEEILLWLPSLEQKKKQIKHPHSHCVIGFIANLVVAHYTGIATKDGKITMLILEKL